MKPRQILRILQLPKPQRFQAISEGMQLALKNANRLWASAESLFEADRGQAARIIEAFVEEEAAKFHILLDSCRCFYNQAQLSESLRRFNDHLAKGLYARVYPTRPSSLGELQEYLDDYRSQYYLDGPNDIDWIFRNDILQSREGAIYVDYVSHDEGDNWVDPGAFDSLSSFTSQPNLLTVANSLSTLEFDKPRNLEIVCSLWNEFEISHDLAYSTLREYNLKTVQAIHPEGLEAEYESAVSDAVNRWKFPMGGLDLSLKAVDLDELRERRHRAIARFYDSV